jgi:mono/diheme cytochrome c family protein
VRRRLELAIGGTLALVIAGFAAAAASGGPAQQSKEAGSSSSGDAGRGAQVFITNCVRCHTPPQGLSPREVPAVVRHMRERANLTEQAERDLLAYLAPGTKK